MEKKEKQQRKMPAFLRLRKISLPLSLCLLLLLGVGCHHKDLDDDPVAMTEIDIRFDWSLAPDANPASMGVAFFSDNARAIRFDFTGRDGGQVRMPAGSYVGLAFNSDDEDWVKLRDVDDIEAVEIHTAEVSVLRGGGISVKALPGVESKSAEEAGETIVESPRLFWTDREDNMVLTGSEKKKELVFTPEEGVCHYTVTVLNVSKLANLDGRVIDATLSGMSGGYLEGQRHATDSRVTFPIILYADAANNRLQGNLLTFGENPSRKLPHKLTLYIILKDGSKRYYIYDVADQIYNAPDPKHVDIVVSGLDLPETTTGGGGFKPDVQEWQTENRDLQM